MLLSHPYRALVIGSTGAIGAAFVRACRADPHCDSVSEVSRRNDSGFDLADEASIQRAAERCTALGPFHLIVDATGALSIHGVPPEKSLTQLCAERLLESFKVNAFGPALLVKHFAPLLAAGPSVYAKLSARVGSISDNRLGGWYGYRASKAALNMLLQTAAIELQRRNPALRVVALQPGTVDSALSRPFQAGVKHLLSADESVAGLMEALRSLPEGKGAQFVDYRGAGVPW